MRAERSCVSEECNKSCSALYSSTVDLLLHHLLDHTKGRYSINTYARIYIIHTLPKSIKRSDTIKFTPPNIARTCVLTLYHVRLWIDAINNTAFSHSPFRWYWIHATNRTQYLRINVSILFIFSIK